MGILHREESMFDSKCPLNNQLPWTPTKIHLEFDLLDGRARVMPADAVDLGRAETRKQKLAHQGKDVVDRVDPDHRHIRPCKAEPLEPCLHQAEHVSGLLP